MRETVQELIERYQNNLYAVAFNVCKNAQDANGNEENIGGGGIAIEPDEFN